MVWVCLSRICKMRLSFGRVEVVEVCSEWTRFYGVKLWCMHRMMQ